MAISCSYFDAFITSFLRCSLILLAQNRQTDRDRVANAQDRSQANRLLADTEFLARELADLRIALNDVATRDYIKGELRDLIEELQIIKDKKD